jgi:hypothetical protein
VCVFRCMLVSGVEGPSRCHALPVGTDAGVPSGPGSLPSPLAPAVQMQPAYWKCETECHAAMRAGGTELIWNGSDVSDQHVEWISSALTSPLVRPPTLISLSVSSV